MIEVGGLSTESSLRMWGHLCERRRVDIPASLLPRASERLGRNPRLPANAGREIFFRNAKVPDAVTLENLYAASVTEGKLNRYWREFFENTFPDRGRRGRAIRFLKRVLCDRFPLDTVEGAISLMGASEEKGGRPLRPRVQGAPEGRPRSTHVRRGSGAGRFPILGVRARRPRKGTSQVAAAIVQARLSHTAPEPGRGGPRAPCRDREGVDAEVGPAGSAAPSPRFRDVSRKVRRKGLLEVVIGMEHEAVRVRLPKVSSVSTGYRASRGGRASTSTWSRTGSSTATLGGEPRHLGGRRGGREEPGHPRRGAFRNRCRLLALEKGLPNDRLRSG